MSITTYPLGLPDELMEEVRRTAADTYLSMEDAMRLLALRRRSERSGVSAERRRYPKIPTM